MEVYRVSWVVEVGGIEDIESIGGVGGIQGIGGMELKGDCFGYKGC